MCVFFRRMNQMTQNCAEFAFVNVAHTRSVQNIVITRIRNRMLQCVPADDSWCECFLRRRQNICKSIIKPSGQYRAHRAGVLHAIKYECDKHRSGPVARCLLIQCRFADDLLVEYVLNCMRFICACWAIIRPVSARTRLLCA